MYFDSSNEYENFPRIDNFYFEISILGKISNSSELRIFSKSIQGVKTTNEQLLSRKKRFCFLISENISNSCLVKRLYLQNFVFLYLVLLYGNESKI